MKTQSFSGVGRLVLVAGLSALLLAGCGKGQVDHLPPESMDGGDTAFMLVSAALVMLMTPALAMFYGGLVRTKNVLSVFMHCFSAMGIITVLWVLLGYSLAFSPSAVMVGDFSLLGGLHWAFLGARNIGMDPHPVYASTIPHRLFMIYQGMFAIITPALICGAVAERMKFKSFIAFISIWLIFVYAPIAHWTWSENGWLLKLGSLDFAGGTVVHMSSGIAALVAALMVKPRRGFPREAFIPHNLVFTALGAGLLWFGWFGFNAGSAVGSTKVAVVAFVSTQCAAAAGILGWVAFDWLVRGKPTLLGGASGAIAGLVAITPASGFVSPSAGIVIGLASGVLCAWFVGWRARKGLDDALDAFSVHGVGGTLGALLTGVFASHYLNEAVDLDAQGLVHGSAKLLGLQALSVVITFVYTFVVSWVILKVIDLVFGLRVSNDQEQVGLDLTEHGEAAYNS